MSTTKAVVLPPQHPRRYQIEDHLGNVHAVVSDNKLADTTGGGIFLSANTEALSHSGLT